LRELDREAHDMSRKEMVFLISRALALLWGIGALTDALYLPERLFSAYHYMAAQSMMNKVATDAHIGSLYRSLITPLALAPIFLILHVGVLALIATVFWKCGPRIARLFEPPSGD
jgi:hypothetical protein